MSFSNLFNSAGELNAYDQKGALEALAKIASVLERGTPSNVALAGRPEMSSDKRDALFERALFSQEGKIALAQSMANPIRTNLDYQGVARRALVVDPLGQGVLPVYNRDIDVHACIVSSNGSTTESRVFGDSITVPEIEIVSNPTVRIAEARRRKFNVLDRAVQKARQEIQAVEDAAVFSAFDSAASLDNEVQDLADAGLTKRDLSELKIQVDQWDLVTSKFFMSIREFNDILNWASGGGQVGLGEVDVVTQREIMQSGLLAKIWGADIIVSKIVPRGTVYAVADPEFVGVMPVRQGIEVMPADMPIRLSIGWVISEIIGIGIVNARGVSKGTKSLIAG